MIHKVRARNVVRLFVNGEQVITGIWGKKQEQRMLKLEIVAKMSDAVVGGVPSIAADIEISVNGVRLMAVLAPLDDAVAMTTGRVEYALRNTLGAEQMRLIEAALTRNLQKEPPP